MQSNCSCHYFLDDTRSSRAVKRKFLSAILFHSLQIYVVCQALVLGITELAGTSVVAFYEQDRVV